MLFHKQIFRFNFGMPFEVNNFAIRTWNVVLISECRFVSQKCRFRLRNLRFSCGRAFGFGDLQLNFRNAVKFLNFAIWFQMCGFGLRKPFLFQKAVCIWTTVCKTIRPMLSDRCLSCLSVTLMYCGQTVEWIRMPLGMEIDLGPGHTVLDGEPAPPRKGTQQRVWA